MTESINNLFSSQIFSNYLGIIITIIIGVIGIIFTIYFSNNQRNKSILEYYPRIGLRLYRDLAGAFDDLEIKYKNETITDNLMFLQGYLICRRCDIESHKDDKGNNLNIIDIEIPNEYVFKDLKVTSNSDKLNEVISSNVDKDNPHKGTVTFVDFRNKECINILYLIQSQNKKASKPKIHFSHRIKDVENEVRMMSPIGRPYSLKSYYSHNWRILCSYLLIGFLFLIVRFLFGLDQTYELLSIIGYIFIFSLFIPIPIWYINNQKDKNIHNIIFPK